MATKQRSPLVVRGNQTSMGNKRSSSSKKSINRPAGGGAKELFDAVKSPPKENNFAFTVLHTTHLGKLDDPPGKLLHLSSKSAGELEAKPTIPTKEQPDFPSTADHKEAPLGERNAPFRPSPRIKGRFAAINARAQQWKKFVVSSQRILIHKLTMVSPP